MKKKKLNTTGVHDTFLDSLEILLPEGVQPIILSDAIFKTPWFKTIGAKNWYWAGRVRGNVQLSLDGETYSGCTSIMEQATGTYSGLESVFYSKSTQFPCQGVLYRGREKGTHKKKKRGGTFRDTKSRDTKSLYYSRKAKQPWLLVYHLPEKYDSPQKVVKLYRCRMQIEEAFIDTKNQQYGLGLAQAKSKSPERYDSLLLIAALTLFLLWCMGKVAVDKQYHHQLQANSERNKTVLSHIYLAMQIINDLRYQISVAKIEWVIENISKLTQNIEEIS